MINSIRWSTSSKSSTVLETTDRFTSDPVIIIKLSDMWSINRLVGLLTGSVGALRFIMNFSLFKWCQMIYLKWPLVRWIQRMLWICFWKERKNLSAAEANMMKLKSQWKMFGRYVGDFTLSSPQLYLWMTCISPQF